MAALQPILDHIVILVPHATLVNLPSWLSEAFTVLEGGRHADGVTENKLILFRDGVYLELIAFIPGKEKEREAHRWGQRQEGHIVDWANTLHSEDELAIIRGRIASAASGIKYTEPSSGGRVRPDGVELKWTISAPYIDDGALGEFAGGEAPFWCLDRTPRHLRVPHKVESNVKHPSEAMGLAGITVSVRDVQLFEKLRESYNALQGQDGRLQIKGDGAPKTYVWNLLVPEGDGVGSTERTLTLAYIDPEPSQNGPPDVHVGLELVASRNGSVSGQLGDANWLVEFKLKAR